MNELSFRVAREVPGERDELLALAINLKIARAAYHAAAKEYPDDVILLKRGIPAERHSLTRSCGRVWVLHLDPALSDLLFRGLGIVRPTNSW